MQILARARSSSGSSTTKSSPPSSPFKSPSKTISLNVAGVANVFLKIRHSPTRTKANHIESSSGDPQTHPTITLDTYEKIGPLELKETYVCSDAVDMQFLLRTTRNALLQHACSAGLNTLVDEQPPVFERHVVRIRGCRRFNPK
ncbi:hypothetical protein H0H87_005235 [Tephrocybe sp. NHM501043]|nr:hypothetical protein H0H87_005235 [Tephrocybe sp. NHM501043]